MNTIIRGLHIHNKSGKLYNVIGTGRNVNDPRKIIVIYEQMYNSYLNGTNIFLPI
jgi:hypothetical protein